MQNQTLEARVARLEKIVDLQAAANMDQTLEARIARQFEERIARAEADSERFKEFMMVQKAANEELLSLMDAVEVELKKAHAEMKRSNESLAAKDALLLAQAERIAGQSEALAGRAEKPRKQRKKGN